MSNQEIRDFYDSSNITLRELSRITGKSQDDLFHILCCEGDTF
jgi:hypothetical protein